MIALTSTAFADALAAYRQRWPQDGYIHSRQRFLETYALLRQHYAGGRIVDVGGWPGDFACTLAALDLPVTVLDKDLSRAIRKTQDAASGHWVLDGTITLADRCRECGIQTVECDIERDPIPLDDQSADFLIFTEIIEHLRKGLLHTLRELRRVLRPGGKLLISTPNLLSLQNRISFLLGRASYDTLEMPYEALAAEERVGHGGHFRVFSMPELVDLLTQSGFQVIHRAYRQILNTDQERRGWSLYDCRMRAKDWLGRSIAPLGNTMFVVATRS